MTAPRPPSKARTRRGEPRTASVGGAKEKSSKTARGAKPEPGAAKARQGTGPRAKGSGAEKGKPAESAGTPRKGKVGPRAIEACYAALRAAHPDAHCELVHNNAFELVVATALSAQTTDVAVNKATPALFAAYPTPAKLAAARPEDVEAKIATIGMYRQKAKNIVALARMIVEEFGGEVPKTQAELVRLPGVGRKTANVVLGVAFGTPEGVVVDTHVQRITQRLGWTKNSTPETIERDLMGLLPREEWDRVSHTLIFHGRRICVAAKPACASCPVQTYCASAFRAENVGRKPPRPRA